MFGLGSVHWTPDIPAFLSYETDYMANNSERQDADTRNDETSTIRLHKMARS